MFKGLFRIFCKIDSFQSHYDDVKRWFEPIHRIAQILEPAEKKTSEAVRDEMTQLLQWVEQTYTEEKDQPMVKNLKSYTKGFWKGLFTCYDHPHVPRTNNDHERFFRRTKTRHRRMTGLRNWNEYILRNGEFIVLVDDALSQSDIVRRLSMVPYETFKQMRQQWRERLSESTKRRRFRQDPVGYLQKLENKVCTLIGPP